MTEISVPEPKKLSDIKMCVTFLELFIHPLHIENAQFVGRELEGRGCQFSEVLGYWLPNENPEEEKDQPGVAFLGKVVHHDPAILPKVLADILKGICEENHQTPGETVIRIVAKAARQKGAQAAITEATQTQETLRYEYQTIAHEASGPN